MIESLQLKNFRCFQNHHVPLRAATVIVGRNNAGKSTIVEAFRLVSMVANRITNLIFKRIPAWTDLPKHYRGVTPSLEGMGFNFDTVFHRYGDPPATITARFDTGALIDVYIGPKGEVYGVVMAPDGSLVTTKGEARRVAIPPVNILPQVAPLALEERILVPDYVRGSMASTLAPLHFRNELNLFPNAFKRFKELAESTWPGLRIRALEGGSGVQGRRLGLMVQDGDFVAEVAWMGHGLQMWLQTMWFLTRVGTAGAVILDEPDVYMHADLQRKLVRLVRRRYTQTIIATHSVEIIAEVDPENILITDRRQRQSRFATSIPAVQTIIDNVGGVHNLHLARLWSARRFLLVEGDDLELLRPVQNILFPDSDDPLDVVPHMSIGGWGGWVYAVGSSMALRNASNEEITVYCLLDRDYHTPQDIKNRLVAARDRGVELHVWERKEIENYFIVSDAIRRTIESELPPAGAPPTAEQLSAELVRIVDNLRKGALQALAEEFLAQNKRGGFTQAHVEAEKVVDAAWQTLEGRLALVSGKQVLSALSAWSQTKYGVSLSARKIARHLRKEEVAPELAMVVSAIERRDDLSTSVVSAQ